MHSYRSLVAWKTAHQLCIGALRATDKAYHPRVRVLFDQVRRAAVSIEANIVEGYALGTKRQFRRHLRIALASAAELECLLNIVAEMNYMSEADIRPLQAAVGNAMPPLAGLVRALSRRIR